MAHLDDSDATALSHSSDSDKSLLEVPVSPATSELPELLNTAIPIAEHDKLPRTRPREETPDRCRSSYLPVIPPKHPNRTLVLCFDGTGDQFDADNSNIVQLVSLLNKDDTSQQMVYYQARCSKTMFFAVRLTSFCAFFFQRLVLEHMRLTEIREALRPRFAKYYSNMLQFSYFIYLLFIIQTLDEMVAWSIDAHIIGTSRSLYHASPH